MTQPSGPAGAQPISDWLDSLASPRHLDAAGRARQLAAEARREISG